MSDRRDRPVVSSWEEFSDRLEVVRREVEGHREDGARREREAVLRMLGRVIQQASDAGEWALYRHATDIARDITGGKHLEEAGR